MPINKEKLELRAKIAAHRPDFKRYESWRYKRLETTWRKPKGVDNHQRKQKSRGIFYSIGLFILVNVSG